VHAAADRDRALALAGASLDRLGVCNRLNLALLDRGAEGLLGPLLDLFAQKGLEVRGDVPGAEPLDRPIGFEWAGDPERASTVTVALVDGIDDALRIANTETSGLAAGIVTEDARAADRFLDGYRGTAAFWHAPTRFADGFELTGSPETGINVDGVPGPRGPVTYRDLWLRQYRVVGDGSQTR
jgi:glutamate-5-semialdehyde dehydrogenase